MKEVRTVFNREMNAHVATLEPEHGSIRVLVHVDRYEHLHELDEIFLYNFDADGNCIEFPFGTRKEDVEKRMYITYSTDGAIHRPPFRVEISHQLETAHLDRYAFTIQYQEV